MRKSQIWISAVLYALIAVAILVIVLEAGIPIIKGIMEKSAFERSRDVMVGLDQQIEDIASEGQGSQRAVPIDINMGKIDIANQMLRWKLETESEVVAPKTTREMGNLIISSDVDVAAFEYDDYYLVENSKIWVNFSKNGTETSWKAINASQLINAIKFKDNNVFVNGSFVFYINESESSNTGTGYTKLSPKGYNLAASTLTAHINSTTFEYDMEFRIDSKADFIKINLKNVKVK